LPELGPLVRNLRLLTPPDERDDLEAIVVRPARRYGYTFQGAQKKTGKAPLLDRLLEDARQSWGARSPGTTPPAGTRQVMPLPLLEFALQQLWLEAAGRGSHQFTHDDYDKIGGLGGAIARHAGRVYDSLPQSTQLGVLARD